MVSEQNKKSALTSAFFYSTALNIVVIININNLKSFANLFLLMLQSSQETKTKEYKEKI